MAELKHQFRLEIYHPYSEPYNPLDDDVVVYVYLEDGRVFHGWFFTPPRIRTLMEKDKLTGESANGSYFWVTDCIIINEISQEKCECVVDYLLERGQFFEAFSDITEDLKKSEKIYAEFLLEEENCKR